MMVAMQDGEADLRGKKLYFSALFYVSTPLLVFTTAWYDESPTSTVNVPPVTTMCTCTCNIN